MINYYSFKRIDSDTFLITNDFGEHAFLSNKEFHSLVAEKVSSSSSLYKKLTEKLFILNESDVLADSIRQRLRNIKDYSFRGTSLHIFVVTNACNLSCKYCQARASDSKSSLHMSREVARKAVDIALSSPSNDLTFEFQGGEPLLNFPIIQEIVLYTSEVNQSKHIRFSLVSNLSLLTDEMIDFFINHNVTISTSIDGPQYIHDANRPHRLGRSSFALLTNGLNRIRNKGLPVSAIQTTTRESLGNAQEIVHTYEALGAGGVFIRPLTPLGSAKEAWDVIGYTPSEFLYFYREAFEEVLYINRTKRPFLEQHAALFLRKILHGHGLNYMELRSPCGAGVGQLAYNYDGNIYTCDEGRMVAESGDQSFVLGNVMTSTYESLISCDTCRAVCSASILETLPGCSDCIYQPYCGVCPVVNYADNGDIFPRGPRNYRCQIYSGMLDVIFEYLHAADRSTIQILESWTTE